MNRYKYPRTPHLPWSPGSTSDDIHFGTAKQFEGKLVVVTEKMDGENTTLYRDHIHARSTDSRHHPSRDWVKGLHGRIAHHIPEHWRICGENLFAQHAISYNALPSYFLAFSIWTEDNTCLPWSKTIEWLKLPDLTPPIVIYQGLWDENTVKSITVDTGTSEGYVVRCADSFHYSAFTENIAKWVRVNHVQTDKHWMHAEVTPNGLAINHKTSAKEQPK